MAYLEAGIFYELDTYWIQSAGLDPAEIIAQFGSRAPLLHIKDGPAGEDTSAPMTALGEGELNFEAILEASGENAEWLIVELDRCASDMMVAVEKSYAYLAELVAGG